MQLKVHHQDLKVLHENTLPARAYYIPLSPLQAAAEANQGRNFNLEREESERFQLLNGEWDFGFYPNLEAVPTDFLPPQPPRSRRGFRCLAPGSIMATISINTPISTILSPLIRLMFPIAIPPELIATPLTIKKTRRHLPPPWFLRG